MCFYWSQKCFATGCNVEQLKPKSKKVQLIFSIDTEGYNLSIQSKKFLLPKETTGCIARQKQQWLY
jgi:hypothetical protein